MTVRNQKKSKIIKKSKLFGDVWAKPKRRLRRPLGLNLLKIELSFQRAHYQGLKTPGTALISTINDVQLNM